MNLLVTGACGHIGSYLIDHIDKIRKISNIFLIDNFKSEKVSSLFRVKSKKKIHFILKDLKNPNSLNDLKKIDIVIHLASLTNAAGSFKNKKEMFENNLNSFQNVLDFCIKRKSKLLIKYGRISHESVLIQTIKTVKFGRQLLLVGGSYF